MNTRWQQCIDKKLPWSWRGGKLWHLRALAAPVSRRPVVPLQSQFVGHIYADQNRSRAVVSALKGLLAKLGPDSVGLNIGAGGTRFENVVNLEIADGSNVDIVGHGSELPFVSNSVDLVIMQEVLEHVPDYLELLREIRRVLKPGGVYFCQVPFQIGFHPGPCDYWRFTRQGLEHLFREPQWEMTQLSISLGHGSGFYRIAVEFVAVTASCLWAKSYRPAKGLAALILYPFKWFDLLTEFSLEKDRIPGGYFCISRKRETAETL